MRVGIEIKTTRTKRRVKQFAMLSAVARDAAYLSQSYRDVIDFAAALRPIFAPPSPLANGAPLPAGMPPRTLATLAHALSVAPDLEASLLALAESLSEVDRFAQLALVRFDARRSMLVDRLIPKRSEERRVGKECPSKCRSRWSPYH